VIKLCMETMTLDVTPSVRF